MIKLNIQLFGGRGSSSSSKGKISFGSYLSAKKSGDTKTQIAWNKQMIKSLEKKMKETSNYNLHFQIDNLKEKNKELRKNLK